MDPLHLLIIGPGRAGMALALAAVSAGHTVDAVVGRTSEHAAAAAADLGVAGLGIEERLPASDLAIIAVRDDAIEAVARLLAAHTPAFARAVHLSGLVAIGALDSLSRHGVAVGSFHPLQTLPTPETGARRLAGAAVAVTAGPGLADLLHEFAASLGATSFDLADAAKPTYHAAAAAAANFPVVALAMARDLFAAAGVDFDAARPLVDAIVANSFELGPRAALTGPVARGDVATVASQIEAVRAETPEWEPAFRALVGELARLTGRRDLFEDLLEPGSGR